MIYITGDTHGYIDVSKLNIKNWSAQTELTKDDHLIVLGDFGFLWGNQPDKSEKYWLKWFDEKKFTTLFIDGNHENHNRLMSYPITEWHGGKVHQISKSVYHLMRGQYYEIDGLTFWTMGGARSHDISDGIIDLTNPADVIKFNEWKTNPSKMFRIKNVSWWENEVPSAEERTEGIANLEAHDWKVDFILTHEAPAGDVWLLSNHIPDEYSRWLDEIRSKADYQNWFYGHYHRDYATSYHDICLYNKIIPVSYN